MSKPSAVRRFRARRPSPAIEVIGARLTVEDVRTLDREVERLRQSNPAAGHASRSSVIRALVAKLRRRALPAAADGPVDGAE